MPLCHRRDVCFYAKEIELEIDFYFCADVSARFGIDSDGNTSFIDLYANGALCTD